MSVTEPSVSQLFWSAAKNEPLPVVQAETKSSCCGPKTAATKTEASTAETEAPAVKSSCCGPKPVTEEKAAATAKKSCCG
ncbi:hypothetical protein ABZT47_04005 [Sphaerisporangium sp. NPDC005289]|uniref:hypothetical protein n=1 Tax=Sphaerisporangium sp. NPDC005289 TaxID=3155247 RepID=UPI0033A4FC24